MRYVFRNSIFLLALVHIVGCKFDDSKGGTDTDSGWSFLDGSGTSGLNFDSSQPAGAPHLIQFNSKLYAIWSETTGINSESPLRVAVYNGLDDSPSWAFVDGGGGLYWYSDKRAGEVDPKLIVFNSKLYALWGERGANNAIQIRVAVYGGNDISPTWSFVDGNGSGGLNKSSGANAYDANYSVFNGKLYLTWSEFGTPSVIRVKVYNGNDSAPAWTFVDGNSPTAGINWDNTKSADAPQLIEFNSKLYAFWSEMDPTVGHSRVAVYNGNDSSPTWTFIDGNGVAGINVNSSHDASPNTSLVFNGKLYLATCERNSSGVYQLRAAVYNGNDFSPAWQYLGGDSENGLNQNTALNSCPTDSVTFNSKLILAAYQSNYLSSIRVLGFNGDDNLPIWNFEDGGGDIGLNKETSGDAAGAKLTVFNSNLYAIWHEGSPRQIRFAKMK